MTMIPCRTIDIVDARLQLDDGRHHRIGREPSVHRSAALAPKRWIVDRLMMVVDGFCCERETLRRMAMLQPGDLIISPLFPGSSCTTEHCSTV